MSYCPHCGYPMNGCSVCPNWPNHAANKFTVPTDISTNFTYPPAMTSQTLLCREAFEKWNTQDNRAVTRWDLWQAAWNAAPSFDRQPETSRRQAAVELLLSLGYVWNDGKWNTRAQSSAPEGGEAVAWLEVEPGVSLEKAVSEYGTMCYSMRVHVGRKRPDVAQDSNGLFPLYTRSNAQGGVPFDRIDQIIKTMQAYRYEADEYKGRYITSSWETMLGELMTEFGAPGYTALSTSRSNDKGTE